MLGFWRLIYNPELKDTDENNENFYLRLDPDETLESFYHKRYWNRDVLRDPSSLLFWFDFIDGKSSELSKYSVKAIGDRTKVVNNDKIRAIYYGEIPTLIYINYKDYNDLKKNKLLKDGYTYILLPEGMEDYFDATRK